MWLIRLTSQNQRWTRSHAHSRLGDKFYLLNSRSQTDKCRFPNFKITIVLYMIQKCAWKLLKSLKSFQAVIFSLLNNSFIHSRIHYLIISKSLEYCFWGFHCKFEVIDWSVYIVLSLLFKMSLWWYHRGSLHQEKQHIFGESV